MSENPKPAEVPQQELGQAPDIQEAKKQEYHFEEMSSIEPAMASLIRQLRHAVESGEYGVIVGEGNDGRLPALILRKVIREKGLKLPETYFLASGEEMPYPEDPRERTTRIQKRNYNKLANYLKKIDPENKRLLVVTELFLTGRTLNKIAETLKDIGIDKFDIATTIRVQQAKGDFGFDPKYFQEEFNSKIFIGETRSRSESDAVIGTGERYMGVSRRKQLKPNANTLSERSGYLGDKTRKDYSPIPETIFKHITRDGRTLSDEEFRAFFTEKEEHDFLLLSPHLQQYKYSEQIKNYKKARFKPLNEEEIKEVREKMKLVREDINLMAERIIEKVWPKEK